MQFFDNKGIALIDLYYFVLFSFGWDWDFSKSG